MRRREECRVSVHSCVCVSVRVLLCMCECACVCVCAETFGRVAACVGVRGVALTDLLDLGWVFLQEFVGLRYE